MVGWAEGLASFVAAVAAPRVERRVVGGMVVVLPAAEAAAAEAAAAAARARAVAVLALAARRCMHACGRSSGGGGEREERERGRWLFVGLLRCEWPRDARLGTLIDVM